jgi:nitrogen regulatory protein PII
MKQLIAVINPNDTDELLHSLQEVTNIDKISVSHIKALEEHTREYMYRGSLVRTNSMLVLDKLELSCAVNQNNEKLVSERLAEFTSNIYCVELSEGWDIETISTLDHASVRIAFVIPYEDELIAPLYNEIILEGYNIEKLHILPSEINLIIHYDAIVIDMSIKKYSTEELTKLLNISAGVPIILVNRSDTPLDKIMFIRAGLHNIYEVRDDHTIATSIIALASQYRDSRKQLIKGSINTSDSLFSIVQLVTMQNKAGELLIVLDNNTMGHIYFRDGNIINAKYKNHKGEKALFRIFAHRALSYQFSDFPAAVLPVIALPLMELLMEISRRHDEYYHKGNNEILFHKKLYLKSSEGSQEFLLSYFTEPRTIQEMCDMADDDDIVVIDKLLDLVNKNILG